MVEQVKTVVELSTQVLVEVVVEAAAQQQEVMAVQVVGLEVVVAQVVQVLFLLEVVAKVVTAM
jgi:hypothetical protein